jgi:hypothetical protein
MREFSELHLEMHRHGLPELPALRKRSAERLCRVTDSDLPSSLRKLVERANAVALASLEEFPEDERLYVMETFIPTTSSCLLKDLSPLIGRTRREAIQPQTPLERGR